MYLVVVSLNYKTAPVEIREQLSFAPNDVPNAMKALMEAPSILENVIVSTCNRTEIYAVVDRLNVGRYDIKQFLSRWFQIEVDEFVPYLSIYENEGMINHLYRVTCGLHSMIVGETQILGQIRTSFTEAQRVQTVGTIFNQLFKQAITLAKKAHNETSIGENAVSVSYAAVELAKKIFGNLQHCSLTVIGAGKMVDLALKNLAAQNIHSVQIVNRTVEKAEELAKKYNGKAYGLESLEHVLLESDIVISSTGSKEYMITSDMAKRMRSKRRGRPLFMVDIAVPRDIDPLVSEEEFAILYDIDDLQSIVVSNLAQRQREAERVEIWIEDEIMTFKEWLRTLEVIPVISALREKGMTIQKETMESIERKMPYLNERERKVLSKHTKSIVNQLLKDPILMMKELQTNSKDMESQLDFIAKLFNLEYEEEKKSVVPLKAKSNSVKSFVLKKFEI